MGLRPYISAHVIEYASLDTGIHAAGRPENQRARSGRSKVALGDTDDLRRLLRLDVVLIMSP